MQAKGKGGGKAAKKAAEAEAARLAAEEECTKLDGERQKLEGEEQAKYEAEKAERQRVEAARLAMESERLHQENDSIAFFLGTRANALRAVHLKLKDDVEWRRYLACCPRPDPRLECQINGYLNTLQENPETELEFTLEHCDDNELVIGEAQELVLAAEHFGNGSKREKHLEYLSKIRSLTAAQIDRITAHILQRADEFQNAKGEVQVQAQVDAVKFGLWVNLAKNPRMKTIEIPELNFISELPKSLALASIAVRMLHVYYDELTARAQNEFMAVGGVFAVDLLALPPPPKKVKAWTLRQVTPLATHVSKLPYPIPPAGSDHSMAAASTTATAPPPMGITYPLPSHVLVLDTEPLVGWWDPETETWRTDGVSDVKYDDEAHTMSFQTIKLTSCALIMSRIKLLPYASWNLRPTTTSSSVLTIWPEHNPLPEPISIEVGEGWCKLQSPNKPCLQELLDNEMPPALLLRKLSDSGVHLLPENRDADFCGVIPKNDDVESKLSFDLALIAPAFMISSSKWNKEMEPEDCIFRVSEVTDYTRTEQRDCDKCFDKEKENVLTVLRKDKGCAFLPIKDQDPTMSKDLLRRITPPDDISWEAEALEPLYYAGSLSVLLKGKASESSLETVETASAAFTEALHHLIYTLRLFSFG
eukprot:gene2327-3052_t